MRGSCACAITKRLFPRAKFNSTLPIKAGWLPDKWARIALFITHQFNPAAGLKPRHTPKDVFCLLEILPIVSVRHFITRPTKVTLGDSMSNFNDDSPFSAQRRRILQVLAASPLAGMSTFALAQQFPTSKVNTTKLAVTDTEVTVGQLHSATGTMALSETGSIQAEQLAIDQINAMGGVLGRKIKVIKEDGASDWPTFAEKSKKLLINDRCASVYGCWTSASRKAVLPIFEKENGLL